MTLTLLHIIDSDATDAEVKALYQYKLMFMLIMGIVLNMQIS